MHGDTHGQEPEYDDNIQPETPASVVFMEMMRRAAASRDSDQPESDSDETASAQSPVVPPASARMSAEERRKAAALEAERVQRIQRKKVERRQSRVSALAGLLRSLLIVIVSGALIATILSWGTEPDALNTRVREELGQAIGSTPTPLPAFAPTMVPTPNWMRRIGIVSGHYGPENDPGAVCPDGLTEREINFAVAQLVVLELRRLGFTVDLLEEFDDRLNDYRAAALVSIHANDCRDYGEFVSGYLIAQSESRPQTGPDARLVECLAEHYGVSSGLDRRFGLTRDMTDYHIFNRVNVTTPGVILELGFMLGDRELLTSRPDLLAKGVVNGILCFIEPGDRETPIPPSDPETEEPPAPPAG